MSDLSEFSDYYPDYSYPDYNYSNYNYSSNISDNIGGMCFHPKNRSLVLYLAPYVHSVICALGMTGNTLVIFTYCCSGHTRSMTEVFLLNMAAADLLFALTLPLFIYSQLWAWPLGAAGCKLLRGSYSVNLYGGTLLLACVSVDRYIAIVQARRSFRLRSLAYSRLICGAVWASALLLSVPTFSFYNWYQPAHTKFFMLNGSNPEDPSPPPHVCEFRFNDERMAMRMKVAVPSTQLAVGFFLPLSAMMFCYTAIIVTLMKAKNFQRHKAVRVVLLVVAMFVACNLPYNVVLLVETAGLFDKRSCTKADGLNMALTITQMLAYLRCCLNPLLYAFVGVKFRSHCRRMFQDLCCPGRGSGARRHSSRATSEGFVSSIRRSMESSTDASSFTM